jgi:hypothetical protein
MIIVLLKGYKPKEKQELTMKIEAEIELMESVFKEYVPEKEIDIHIKKP